MSLSLDVRLPLDRFALSVTHEATQAVTGVFGPSGAGKTSLLETIAGLRRGARGRIAFGDRVWLDTASRPARRLAPQHRGIGYVPQASWLFPHLDVRGNLLAGSARARQRGVDPQRRFDEACTLLALEPLLDRDVASLSGGEQRRVALGRALGSAPDLLLLDEPLAALDLELRRKVLPYLLRLRQTLDLPMLVVSHDPDELAALCDTVLVLRDGQVVDTGPPETVLDRTTTTMGEDRADNALHATVVSSTDDTITVRLADATLDVPRDALPPLPATDLDPGDSVRVIVAARAIWLAEAEPVGLVGATVLHARIVDRDQAELADGQQVRFGGVPTPTPTPGTKVVLVLRGIDARVVAGHAG